MRVTWWDQSGWLVANFISFVHLLSSVCLVDWLLGFSLNARDIPVCQCFGMQNHLRSWLSKVLQPHSDRQWWWRFGYLYWLSHKRITDGFLRSRLTYVSCLWLSLIWLLTTKITAYEFLRVCLTSIVQFGEKNVIYWKKKQHFSENTEHFVASQCWLFQRSQLLNSRLFITAEIVIDITRTTVAS